MKYVIAPRNYRLSLLNCLRGEDPFLDLKILSKEDLARYYYISLKEEAVLFLMNKHHFSYEIAKMYLEDIRFVSSSDNPKISFLNKLKQELIDNDLVIEPMDSDFQNLEMDVYGYSEHDFELSSLLSLFSIKPHYKKYEDKKGERTINFFEKVEEETFYVLNQIASLIDNGISINDIYIFRRNYEYDYYLIKFAPSFGYQLNIKSNQNFLSSGAVKEFIKLYDEKKDIEEALSLLKEAMKDDPLYLEIEDLVRSYTYEVPFEIQRDYLINKFKEKVIVAPRYDAAINVTSEPLFLNNKHVFVMGFSQGLFPLSYRDDKFLNNEELKSINRLNSKDKTKVDFDVLFSFFNSNNNFYYSYSSKSVSSKFYPSPFIKTLTYKEEHPKLNDVFYSISVLKLIYANLKDLDYLYKEKGKDYYKVNGIIDIDFNTYDNSYTNKVKTYNEDSEIRLSTTSLDLYFQCAFHYYLEHVLKVDEIEGTFPSYIGNIAHHIFEHMREENFDFDKEFDAKTIDLPLKTSEKYILSHNVKEQIRTATNAIKEREKYYRNPSIYNERKFVYQIDEHTTLEGRIDNLVTLDNKYYLIIDYKTGSKKFEDSKIKDGLSTQLPTYALLTKEDNKFKDLTLIGIYINNVLTNSLYVEQKEEELIPGYLKLNGKTLANIEAISYLDSTISGGKSSFINQVAIKKDGCSLKASNAIVGENELDNYVETVTELYKNMSAKLRDNIFDINPYFVSDRDNACQYCPYKDICYVRNNQYRLLEKEENEDE